MGDVQRRSRFDPRRLSFSLSRMGLRHHFRSDGTAKAAYSKDHAIALAERMGKRAYVCSVCHEWHLATPKTSRKAEKPVKRYRRAER